MPMDGGNFYPAAFGAPSPFSSVNEAGRTNIIQHYRTATSNNPPAPNSLAEGEFCIEMGTPMRVWIGVPLSLDSTGQKILFDRSVSAGVPDAPTDGQSYARRGADETWQPALTLAGGTMTGPLLLAGDPTQPLGAVTMQWVQTNFAPIVGGGYLPLNGGGTVTGQITVTPTKNYTGNFAHNLWLGTGTGAGNPSIFWGATGGATCWSIVNFGGSFYTSIMNSDGTWNRDVMRVSTTGSSTQSFVMQSGTSLMLSKDPTAALEAATRQWSLATFAPIAGGGYVMKTGDSMSGTLSITTSGVGLLVTGSTGNWATIRLNAPTISPNTANLIDGRKSGLARWQLMLGDTDAETGGNAGSNVRLYPFDDSGVAIGSQPYLLIVRQTGEFRFNGPITANQPITLAADPTQPLQVSSKQYVDALRTYVNNTFLPFTGGNLTGPLSITASGTAFSVVGLSMFQGNTIFTGGSTTFQTGGTGVFVNNQPLTLAGSSVLTLASDPTAPTQAATKRYTDNAIAAAVANYLPLTGGTLTGPLYIAVDGTALAVGTNTATNPTIVINRANGGWGTLEFETAGVARWRVDVDATSETGNNVGSNFNIYRMTDAGAVIDAPFAINRATAAINLTGALTVGGATSLNSTLHVNQQATFGSTVTLAGNPSTALQAVPKQYVDTNFLPFTGGTLTGALTINAVAGGYGQQLILASPNSSSNPGMMIRGTPGSNGIEVSNWGGNLYWSVYSPGGGLQADLMALMTSATPYALQMLSGVNLMLDHNPTLLMEAATKQYVDNLSPQGKYVLITGDTMEGALEMAGYQLGTLRHPVQPDDAATKEYVDLISAASYQGEWQVASNNPDLNAAIPNNANAYEWYAQLVDPAVPETAPSIPGIAGQLIHEGDRIIWSSVEQRYDVYSGGVLDRSTGDALYVFKSGDTMTGPLTMSTAGGIGIQAGVANNPMDLSKHLELYPPNYGFSVTSGTVNLVSGNTFDFYSNSSLMFRVSGGGIFAYTQLYLPGDPTSALGAATKQYVDAVRALLNNYLPLSGGTMTGPIQMRPDVPIYFNNNSQLIRSRSGIDNAWLSGANLEMASWFGWGLGTTCPGQTIPVGLNGLYVNTRSGDFTTFGSGNFGNSAYIGKLGIYPSGTTDMVLQASGWMAYTVAIAASGTSINVNDRFYDQDGNIYTITTTDGAGAATGIRFDHQHPIFFSPPANPVALTAAPGFTGSGLTVNLTWQQAGRINFQSSLFAQYDTTLTGPLTVNNSGTFSGVVHVTAGGNALVVDNQAVANSFAANTNIVAGVSGNNGSLYLRGDAANAKNLVYQTGASTRWMLGTWDNAEPGGNAGTNLYLQRFDDNGNFIDNVMMFNRANGGIGLNKFVSTPIYIDPPVNSPSLYIQDNWNNALPNATWGGAIGFNYTAGGGEVSFMNCYVTGGGDAFDWWQMTSASASAKLMSLSRPGNLYINQGSLFIGGWGVVYNGIGGNSYIGYTWTGGRIHAWVNGVDQGAMALDVELGNYVLKTGDTMSGPLNLRYTPTDTSQQLFIAPVNGSANSQEGRIMFGGTFGGGISDLGVRIISSLRAGFTGGWGTEYFSIYVNNGAPNDGASSAAQKLVAQFSASTNTLIGNTECQGGWFEAQGQAYFHAHTLFYNGIDFNSFVASNPQDCSGGIALWGTGTNAYGFCVTNSTLNYNNVGTGSNHDFYSGGVLAARLTSNGSVIYQDLNVQGRVVATQGVYAPSSQSAAYRGAQGTYLMWNLTGEGATWLMNQKGLGSGGFHFAALDTSGNTTDFFRIDGSGNGAFPVGAFIVGGGGVGNVGLYNGGGAPGYIAFFDSTGSRVGYIGFQAITNVFALQTENEFTGWKANGTFEANYVKSDTWVDALTGVHSYNALQVDGDSNLYGQVHVRYNNGSMANNVQSLSIDSPTDAVLGLDVNGVVATNIALRHDGVLEIGGWSWARNLFTMDGAGNTTIAGQLTIGNGVHAPQFVASNTNGGLGAGFLVQGSGNVSYAWNATGSAANEKIWDVLAAGTLYFRAVSDDQSAANTWMMVTRSGATPGSVTFPYPVYANNLLTAQGGGQWSTFNYRNTLVIGSNGGNPAIAFLDSSNANPWAIGKGGVADGLSFMAMPAFGDTTTNPVVPLILSRTFAQFQQPLQFYVPSATAPGQASHINLISSGYIGFNTTDGNGINYWAWTSPHRFYAQGTLTASIGTSGLILASDPTVAMQAATKQYVDNKFVPISGGNYVAKTGDTMSGSLGIQTAGATLSLAAAAGNTNQLLGYRNTIANPNLRWLLALGSAAAESGGNAGTDFVLNRYDDAGNYLGSPFSIARSNGQAVFAQPLYVDGARIFSRSSGNNPAFICYDTGQSAAAGMLLGGSNMLHLANMDGNGNYISARAYWDVNGNYTSPGGISVSGSISVNGGVTSNSTIQSNNGHLIAKSGGGPSVAVWDSNQNAAAGILLGGGNNLIFASLNGDGSWAATRGYIDASGNTTINGSLTCSGAVVCSGGLFQIAANYYLQRSPSDGYWRFVENGTINFTISTGGDATAARDVHCGHGLFTHGVSNNNWMFWFDGGTHVYIRVDSGSDFGPIPYTSDAKFKRDIEPSTFDGLAAINRTRLRSYAIKGNGKQVPVGIIAQEALEDFPEIVDDNPQALNLMLKTDVMLSALFDAVQRLSKENTAMAARLETLERRTLH